ncbi:GGDEF domain-containing protein [Ideonella sp. B7]|uniref:GGDEF domain-containing protein n=1 Tax=Ideonella benzenivorans TaxID=2831643 RepID=UPI001CECBF87|nr:sensor domain-containing diguanylate cyclase [Ideonella benzenivorans]MCA6215023.1 GGDEF domain-containing protein [Ideonella benzenivorans]
MPSRWRGSLLLRLTLGALLAVVVATGCTTWLLVQDAERDTEERAHQMVLQEAARSAGLLSRQLVDRQRALAAAASTVAELQQWDVSPGRRPGLHVLFKRVFLADPQGALIGKSAGAAEPDRLLDSLGKQAGFQAAVRQRRPTMWWFHASEGQLSHVVLVQPIERAGQVRAVLGGVLPLTLNEGLLRDVGDVGPDFGEGASSTLLAVTDAQGQPLVQGEPTRGMPAALRDQNLARALAHWREAGSPVEPMGLVWADGDQLLVGAGIPGPDWMVWRAYSRVAMLAPLDALRTRSLRWAFGVALGLALALMLYLGWQLSPLARLERRVMGMLDGGQRPASGWPRARGEIGALSTTLREVAQALARKDGENRQLFEQLEGVMAAAPLGLGLVRRDRLTLFNAELARLLGYTDQELRQLPLGVLLADADEQGPLSIAVKRAFQSGQPYVGEHRFLRRQGSVFWGQLHARPVRMDQLEAGVVLTLSDITQQVQSRHELEWSASHDALTGLLNRAAFLARLDRFVDAQPRRAAALLVIDLDHFKPINDTEGHQAGDAMLQAVSRVLQNGVRQSDAVGRLGGDEFAVLLDGCPPEWAQRLAHKLLAAVLEVRLPWRDHVLQVSASIGLASWEDRMGHGRAWLHEADTACYGAKRSGRAGVFVSVSPAPAELAQVG